MSTNKQALRIPKREKHNWGQAVMHTCDFCDQYAMTISREGGEHSCASCCDAEYATALTCALEMAIDRAEAAEKRIAELEAREVQLPKPELVGMGEWPMFNQVDVINALASVGISVKGE